MKEASAEEVNDIENQVIEYLIEVAKTPANRRPLKCFVCGRKARGNSHNIKDCIEIVDVSMQVNESLCYT